MTMGYLIGTLICMSSLQAFGVLLQYLVVLDVLDVSWTQREHTVGIYGPIMDRLQA